MDQVADIPAKAVILASPEKSLELVCLTVNGVEMT